MPDHCPDVSVAVMGYRNGPTIVRAVRSIVEQADADVEIVVVTSGGDDSAAQVRAAFPDVPVVESVTRLLPGATRNRGFEATRGRVMAFLEGDCVAEPGWIANRRRCHAAGHPIVASAVTNGDPAHPAAWAAHFGIFGDRLAGRPAGPVRGSDAAAHGCSFDRDVLEQIGPFREDLEMAEDTLVAVRAEGLGYPVWFEPTVRTTHWGPASLGALVRDRYRRGQMRGRMFGPVRAGWGHALLHGWGIRGFGARWGAAGPDRRHLAVCLPWLLAGNGAAWVGRQRSGGALPPGTVPPGLRG